MREQVFSNLTQSVKLLTSLCRVARVVNVRTRESNKCRIEVVVHFVIKIIEMFHERFANEK